MKNKINRTIAFTAIAAFFFLSSCKKETGLTPSISDKNQVAIFNQIANAQPAALQNLLKTQAMASGLIDHLAGVHKTDEDFYFGDFPCAVITKDTTSSPRSITVDFGAGCTNTAGDFMSGSLLLEYVSDVFIGQTGNYIRMTVTNLVDNTDTLNGTYQYTYTGINGSGNYTLAITTNLTTIGRLDELRWRGVNNFSVEFVNDTTGGTNNWIQYLTGSGTGTTPSGLTFTQTVTSQLQYGELCAAHFVSGGLRLQTQGQPDKDFDFGNGACDDRATMTENGVTTNIILP